MATPWSWQIVRGHNLQNSLSLSELSHLVGRNLVQQCGKKVATFVYCTRTFGVEIIFSRPKRECFFCVCWLSVKPAQHIATSNHHHSLRDPQNSLSTNFEPSKQRNDWKKNFRKFSPKTAEKLPHPPMAFFVHKKQRFSKVIPKQVNFLNSSYFVSAQHVRAGPQHAQALTLDLSKKYQVVSKLC